MKIQISETKILEAIDVYNDVYQETAPAMFHQALGFGKKFKDEGLTPFYIFDEEMSAIIVTSQEHMENRLN